MRNLADLIKTTPGTKQVPLIFGSDKRMININRAQLDIILKAMESDQIMPEPLKKALSAPETAQAWLKSIGVPVELEFKPDPQAQQQLFTPAGGATANATNTPQGQGSLFQENYWVRLQNERNKKLNSLVNELKASIK
jgi:hypothetical protein